MKRWMTGTAGIRAAAVCLALASGVSAATPGDREIAGMISRLGNESFAERERASEEILTHAKKQSAEVEKALVEAYRRSPEPEIRFRSKSILMRLYSESVGYVGVHYDGIGRTFLNKQGEQRMGVFVSQIAASSPAAQAGLQPGDMILAINGEPVSQNEPAKDFARRVQILGAGAKVTLKLSRAQEEMDVQITLGKRPALPIPLSEEEMRDLFKARVQKAEQEPANN